MMNNSKTAEINLSEFEHVLPPIRPMASCAITVSAGGNVALNQRLLDALGETEKVFDIRMKRSDGAMLLLMQNSSADYRFPKNGSRKDLAFARDLASKGISLPARYEVAWNEVIGAWVGTLTQTQAVPDVVALTKKHRGTEKRGALH